VDTIKTRLQTTSIRYNDTKSLLKVFRTIIFPAQLTNSRLKSTKLHSLASLYRGLPVTLCFSVPALSVYLSCYEATKQTLDTQYHIQRTSVVSHLISGCAAEIAAGLLFTPMEVMKNRLQTQQKYVTIGNRALAYKIFQTEGLRGFYRGYWMGLAVFVPHSMAYFVTYEKMKQWMIRDDAVVKPNVYMVCSSMAGVTSILLSTPLDIIKTRWQISAAEQGKQYRQGPLSIAKHMLFSEGRGALTRGLWARIAWGIPTTALSMTIFEVIKDSRDKLT
jgi:solute carrier family 25 iron transporter 28/37